MTLGTDPIDWLLRAGLLIVGLCAIGLILWATFH